MRGASTARRTALAVWWRAILLAAAAAPAGAQQWNDPRTAGLVLRATERRAREIADTALGAYSATANGYLTFLGQVGEGLHLPPKILRTDQLALQVYWHAPDQSKQVIIGRRDTLLLPTDIAYHRDHLGIVQNNFPDLIRLGEGDEVRDVPHPLSAAGLSAYDFAITDSLRLRLPDRTVSVYEVRVRPRDASQPRVVGAVYLDTATAQVVRMAFSFTRAAYLDPQLEDISIVLENALVAGRFWLPYRQEVEIRRTGTWLEFPARGIIRGRWEICCYQVNLAVPPSTFNGPEITELSARQLASHTWQGNILDSLPDDARVATDADVRAVQEEARAVIAAGALAPRTGAALSVPRISDVARVDRVEGLALGAGGTWHASPALALGALVRYGFDDVDWKARVSGTYTLASGATLGGFAEREFRDAGDVAERSMLVNSFAAQEYGSDFSDPYLVRGAGVRATVAIRLEWRLTLTAAFEEQSALAVHALPWNGTYGPTIPAWPVDEWRPALRIERAWTLGPVSDLRVDATLSGGWLSTRDTTIAGSPARYGRAFAAVSLSRSMGAQRLVLRTTLAAVTPDGAPPQDQVFLGGPVTGPGYPYHRFAGAFGGSQRVEWRTTLPFFDVALGAFGHTPAAFTLAPYANVVYVDRSAAFAQPAEGWYPSLGLGAIFFFDLVRLDLAYGTRGGGWTFGLDLAHDLWSIL